MIVGIPPLGRDESPSRTIAAVARMIDRGVGDLEALAVPVRWARRPSAAGTPAVLHSCRACHTFNAMKAITVRLPEPLLADIEAESRGRSISKSDVIRERLERAGSERPQAERLDDIADLIGSVDGLPADLSSRTKHYLQATGYGRKRRR